MGDNKALPFIVTIATLLVARSDLDQVKESREGERQICSRSLSIADFVLTDVGNQLRDLSDGNVAEYMFDTLLQLWPLKLSETTRLAVISCIGEHIACYNEPAVLMQQHRTSGSIFLAFPRFMIHPDSTAIMSEIFHNRQKDPQMLLQILSLMYSSLSNLVEGDVHETPAKKVDLEGQCGIPNGIASGTELLVRRNGQHREAHRE